MDFDLSDEQKILESEARRFFAVHSPYSLLRSMLDGGREWDLELWRSAAALGFLGAAIPDDQGGSGLGEIELCVLSQEAGRAVAPVPFCSSICAAAEAIRVAGSPEQRSRWLLPLATGEAIGTYVLDAPGVQPTVQYDDEAGELSGTGNNVPDGQIAHLSIVAALSSGVPQLYLVELGQTRVRRKTLVGFDQLRRHATLVFEKAHAELLPLGAQLYPSLVDRLAVYTAFEQIGGAEACLEMARDYVLQRKIFNRELGSYQAVKHKLADIWAEIELARSNAYFAAWALSNGNADLSSAAAAARLSATSAYELASRENLHLHGGTGYMWETNCHFHYRRSRLLAQSLGGPDVWSDKLIELVQRNNASSSR